MDSAFQNQFLSKLLSTDDVKNMMKDILLIWTAVKQLDASKADRKEVANMAAQIRSQNEVGTESNN